MSIWTQIGDFVATIASQALSVAVESIRTFFEGDPITRKQVAFSIAIIALSAKMAKADGIVSESEVNAFRELFEVPADEAKHVARVYNLAKQDVAGFDAYARQMKNLFPDDDDILRDVVDGLFHIAKADGIIHEKELSFVEIVADVFEIDSKTYQGIKLRHVMPEEGDPYLALGASNDWSNEELKKHYRKLVMENHPDRMIARGVPEEFMKIANDRIASINLSWDHIRKERGL